MNVKNMRFFDLADHFEPYFGHVNQTSDFKSILPASQKCLEIKLNSFLPHDLKNLPHRLRRLLVVDDSRFLVLFVDNAHEIISYFY